MQFTLNYHASQKDGTALKIRDTEYLVFYFLVAC